MGAKQAEQAVMRAVREMIRVNPDAAKAVAAICRRGLPRREAQEELARALTGCLWEVSRGMPDRWPAVLAALKQGKSAASLFPDELYSRPRRGGRQRNSSHWRGKTFTPPRRPGSDKGFGRD